MFEATRQKVLLALALALLGAVVLDRLAVSPLSGYVSEVNLRIEELTADLAAAEREAAARPARAGAEVLRRRLRLPGEQARNELHRYLEAQLGPKVEVTSSAQVSAVDLAETPDLKRISYDLNLLAPQRALRQALENLDASPELLRIERLQIARGGGGETRLKVRILVSALASASAAQPSATRPFPTRPGSSLPALAGNMFFPGERRPAGLAVGETAVGAATDDFILAGTVISARRRAALLEFPATGRVCWIGVGERAGQVTIADVRPDGVLFRLGGQEVALAVGRPSADLLAGRRVLGGGFELVGVCHVGSRRFAMIQPDAGGQIQRVHVKDRLGPGVIARIVDDGIVLEVAGARQAVPVGGRFGG